jgi:hypothetical protein
MTYREMSLSLSMNAGNMPGDAAGQHADNAAMLAAGMPSIFMHTGSSATSGAGGGSKLNEACNSPHRHTVDRNHHVTATPPTPPPLPLLLLLLLLLTPLVTNAIALLPLLHPLSLPFPLLLVVVVVVMVARVALHHPPPTHPPPSVCVDGEDELTPHHQHSHSHAHMGKHRLRMAQWVYLHRGREFPTKGRHLTIEVAVVVVMALLLSPLDPMPAKEGVACENLTSRRRCLRRRSCRFHCARMGDTLINAITSPTKKKKYIYEHDDD